VRARDVKKLRFSPPVTQALGIFITIRGVTRMAIGSVDIKILWGRAGGRCSKPGCDEDLTALVASGNYVVGTV
jgi:hypothetical protein